MANPRERLTRAVAAHRSGRLAEAESLYRQVLRTTPRDFDAQHLLGVILAQTGRAAEGVRILRAALTAKPGDMAAKANLAMALTAGDHEGALEIHDQLIAAAPGEPIAHANRARTLQTLGRLEDAEAAFARAAALNPNYAEIWLHRGNNLRALNRPDDALAAYDRAIGLNPRGAEAHLNRANILVERKQFDDALRSCQKAVANAPRFAEAHSNLGNILVLARREEEALTAYDQALALKPDFSEAVTNRAHALHALGRDDDALAAYSAVIERWPDHAPAWYNRGKLLEDSRRPEEAREDYETAIRLQPNFTFAHINLGTILHEENRFDDALRHYELAIALDPGAANAHWNKAGIMLVKGDMREGWRLFEYRKTLTIPLGTRDDPRPEWLGQDSLADKTLFIHAEQGLGDTLQFFRYARLARDAGARVVMSVQDPLVRLLATSAPDIEVIGADQSPETCDFRCPTMSLPLAFGTTLSTIPAPARYLTPPPNDWAARLAALPGLKVGLVWAGGARPWNPQLEAADKRRSITLEHYAPLAGIPGISFISLQKGPPSGQAREPPPGMVLHDWTDELTDFADTAALTDALDLIISVDTAVAHLAGGLGKPVWILNRFDSCWRWLEDRVDSPWYPSARLFRQRQPGAWAPVIEDVREALSAL